MLDCRPVLLWCCDCSRFPLCRATVMESMDDLGPTLLYRSHILKLEADKEALRSHFSRECAALESAHAESEARRLSVSREYGVAVASMACDSHAVGGGQGG